MSTIATVLLLLTVTALSISAVLAFWWAGRSGQFHEIENGAMSVFDADELEEVNARAAKPHGNRTQ
jgi:cbb3-type cytochrome oxidase maturation protein